MKKINKLFAGLLLSSCIILSGCFSPVFYEIRQDVPPEDTTVQSPVNAITRVTIGEDEYLVINSDKGLRYKRADSSTHDEWKAGKIPFDMHSYDFVSGDHKGQQIMGIYSSSDYLYILSSSIGVNESLGITYPNKVTLWGAKLADITSDGATWSETAKWEALIEESTSSDAAYFPIYVSDSLYHSAFSVIQTNAVQKANRKVFIRRGDSTTSYSNIQTVKYYELNGTKEPAEITPEVKAVSEKKNFARSAVYFNGKVLFFAGYAATTNETAKDAATHYYYSSNNDIYYGTAGSEPVKALSTSKTVSALAYCQDALLIGCADYEATSNSSGGIYKTTISEGIPGSATVSFTTNASFQVSTSYYVTALLNATPDKNELDSYLYCASQIFGTDTNSSGSFSNVGLWSYYPGRGNWNRE